MSVAASSASRVFVVIASYGEKNLACLQQMIRTFRSMDFLVDITVVAEAPKSVDLGVPVISGTPSRNPWSLPFAHQAFIAENVDQYDLYLYAEDDILVTEANLEAFVAASNELADDEIAGFMRFECAPEGTRHLPDVHGPFQWKPDSVRQRGRFTIAEFTNDHAAMYAITNGQLRKALARGAYVRPPYEGRYDMLVSAATDIYVNFGFKKVVCISHLDDFLVHHMTNRYVGQMGIPLSLAREHVKALQGILRGDVPAGRLCAVDPPLLVRYAKSYDERPSDDLIELVKPHMRRILSIGYGFGAMERELQKRGATVTAFPLDSVVGAVARRDGIEVIHGSLDECFDAARERQFDGVLISNLLHLLDTPASTVMQAAGLVAPNGNLIVRGPNFGHLPAAIKRLFGVGPCGAIDRFEESGVRAIRPYDVEQAGKAGGLVLERVHWCDRGLPAPFEWCAPHLGSLACRTWLAVLTRQARRVPTETRAA